MQYILWIASIFIWQASTYFLVKPFQKPERQNIFKYALDDKVPMIPAFIWIYLGCYLWWWYVMGSHYGSLRFAAAAILGYFLAAVTFVEVALAERFSAPICSPSSSMPVRKPKRSNSSSVTRRRSPLSNFTKIRSFFRSDRLISSIRTVTCLAEFRRKPRRNNPNLF